MVRPYHSSSTDVGAGMGPQALSSSDSSSDSVKSFRRAPASCTAAGLWGFREKSTKIRSSSSSGSKHRGAINLLVQTNTPRKVVKDASHKMYQLHAYRFGSYCKRWKWPRAHLLFRKAQRVRHPAPIRGSHECGETFLQRRSSPFPVLQRNCYAQTWTLVATNHAQTIKPGISKQHLELWHYQKQLILAESFMFCLLENSRTLP